MLEFGSLLTPAEAAAVADVPVKALYKTVAERLPKSYVVRRSGQTYLTPAAVLCVRLDYEFPKDVPVRARRLIYSKVKDGGSGRVECGTKLFSYVVDPRPVAEVLGGRMRRYRKAMQLIVEDPEIQAGAATFKGTRLLVHQIADLTKQGVSEKELCEDYPNLTPAMIDAACIFAQAHPRRGRPRRPAWRHSKPQSTKLVRGRGA
jgi:uncharacterized protein (DUF433 family)